MAVTQADIDTVLDAIKNAELRVQHGDRSVQYADIESLKERHAFLTAELAKQTGGKNARQWRLYQAGRGI